MPKYNHPRKTWEYPKSFKIKAVKLSHQEGIKVREVAEGLDIHPMMLSRWRKEYRDGKLTGSKKKRTNMKKKKPTISDKKLTENARLKKENARLKEENDLLKKWQRYLAEQHQNDLDLSKDTRK